MFNYTCSDAKQFDVAMRKIAPQLACQLFESVQSYFPVNTLIEDVEFDSECDNHGHAVDPDDGTIGCAIKLVTIRRTADGPNGNDVCSVFFHRLDPAEQELVRRVHNKAHDLA